MKLVSWNVNSLRARLPRVLGLLDDLEPDVVCLQETKCAAEQVPRVQLKKAGYQVVDHCSGRWNGVALLVAEGVHVDEPARGLAGEPMPDEARWIEATVNGVRVVSVYVPNGARSMAEKLKFLGAAAVRTSHLVGRGPVALAGDLNIAATDLDVAGTFREAPTHVTPAERAALQRIVDSGLFDAYRQHHPDNQGFTWWDYRAGMFRRDIGMRLDYALISSDLYVSRCDVALAYRRETEVGKPSDHAPVFANITAQTSAGQKEVV